MTTASPEVRLMVWCSAAHSNPEPAIAVTSAFMDALDLAFTHPEYAHALHRYMIAMRGTGPPTGRHLATLIALIPTADLEVSVDDD